MLGIADQVQFQLFFESRKDFGFPNTCIVAGRLFQVGLRGSATGKARSPSLVLVPGTKTSDESDGWTLRMTLNR